MFGRVISAGVSLRGDAFLVPLEAIAGIADDVVVEDSLLFDSGWNIPEKTLKSSFAGGWKTTVLLGL